MEVKIAPMDAIWLVLINGAFSCHFIDTHIPSNPIRMLLVLATPASKILSKTLGIQVAMHPIVGGEINYT